MNILKGRWSARNSSMQDEIASKTSHKTDDED